MRRILVFAVAVVFGGVVVAPAPAVVPMKKAGGTVVVTTTSACKVTLSGPGKTKAKRVVPRSGTVKGLSPGSYRVTVSPKTCVSVKKTVKVRKGKATRLAILNDPKLVPTVLSGSFTGQETFSGAVASWSGDMRWELQSVTQEVGDGLLGTGSVATYKLVSAGGTWTISGSNTDCTYAGSGSFTMPDFLMYGDPTLLTDPWSSFAYVLDVQFGDISWAYKETCQTYDGERVRDMRRTIPPQRMVTSNAWLASRPQPPILAGANPAGSLTWQQTNWTWTLDAEAAKEYGKP